MRTRTALVPVLAGLALVATACGTDTDDSAASGTAGADPIAAPAAVAAQEDAPGGDLLTDEEVDALFDTWNEALATGDAAAVTALYADDAVLLSTLSGDVKETPEEIEGYFADTFLPNQPQGVITESYIAVERPGIATHTGLYDFSVTDPATGEQSSVPARFTFVYTQGEDGQWLISSHHSSRVPTS